MLYPLTIQKILQYFYLWGKNVFLQSRERQGSVITIAHRSWFWMVSALPVEINQLVNIEIKDGFHIVYIVYSTLERYNVCYFKFLAR